MQSFPTLSQDATPPSWPQYSDPMSMEACPVTPHAIQPEWLITRALKLSGSSRANAHAMPNMPSDICRSMSLSLLNSQKPWVCKSSLWFIIIVVLRYTLTRVRYQVTPEFQTHNQRQAPEKNNKIKRRKQRYFLRLCPTHRGTPQPLFPIFFLTVILLTINLVT